MMDTIVFVGKFIFTSTVILFGAAILMFFLSLFVVFAKSLFVHIIKNWCDKEDKKEGGSVDGKHHQDE